MKQTDLVWTISETVSTLSLSSSGRVFLKSIDRLVDALSRVPDYSRTAFSTPQLEHLRSLAERAIQVIERRIERTSDGRSVQIQLTGAVYQLRNNIEDIDRWHHHQYQVAGWR